MTHSFKGTNDYPIYSYSFGAFGNCFYYIFMFQSDFGDLERPRSTGGDLENAPCGDSVYHEDELE